MFANYGASQGVDNDDGSSFYAIEDNVFYASDGFKMDYGGHDSRFDRNLVITYQCVSGPEGGVGVADSSRETSPRDDQNCAGRRDVPTDHGDAARNNTCLLIGEDGGRRGPRRQQRRVRARRHRSAATVLHHASARQRVLTTSRRRALQHRHGSQARFGNVRLDRVDAAG